MAILFSLTIKFLFVDWLTKSFLGWWWEAISVIMIQTGIFYRCVLLKNVLQFNYFFSFNSMNNLVDKYNNSIDAYLQRVSLSRTCKKTFKITIIIMWSYFTDKEPDTSKWKIGQNAKQFITRAVASHPPKGLQTCRSRSRKTQSLWGIFACGKWSFIK